MRLWSGDQLRQLYPRRGLLGRVEQRVVVERSAQHQLLIENCTNEAVDESVRNNYIGLARFFRAYFYYEMVVRFGDVLG